MVSIVDRVAHGRSGKRERWRHACWQSSSPARRQRIILCRASFVVLSDTLAAKPDAAILDVNLAGEWVTPVAEVLEAMSVPFILASGYVAADLQAEAALRDAVNVGKTCRPEILLNVLRGLLNVA